MKRSWTLILLVGGFLALLVLLAGVQYVWLAQISEAESERLHKRLQTSTKNFAEDFNKEIRGAYFTFQIDPGDWLKKDWEGFNDRYKLWQTQTAYPRLVKDFYFVGKDSTPIRYEADAENFAPTEWTPELREIEKRIAKGSETNYTVEPIVENVSTLLMPNYASGLETSINQNNVPVIKADLSGYLVIKLDETVVNQLINDLRQRYFSEDEPARYNLSISDKTNLKPIFPQDQGQAIVSGGGDANILLFDLSMGDFRMMVNSKVFSSTKNVKFKRFHLPPKNEPLQPKMNKDDTVKIQMTDLRNTKSNETEAKGVWLLNVQHVDGSLDQFIANERRKNLAIGFGICGVLAISIIFIFISIWRIQVFAQRQVDFVSSVSHEFRTPLAVIYSAGENLADGVAKEDAQVLRYGDLIKGEGKKLTGMVEQILDFAGANSGRRKYNFGASSVSDVVESALAECRPLIDEKDISVETDISASLPSINADSAALSQAIQNLIVNSVKYGIGEKWLRISAENGAGKIKVSVEDRGIGISKSDLRQIFEPFYRSKTVVDAQIHGNGLGLSLVKQIAEAHGGRVFAMSEIGKGSKFTIELPQKKEI